MSHDRFERGYWWLAVALLTTLLALVGCVTSPTTVTEVVLVCVTDWETGRSECHHRECVYHRRDQTWDCLNKPVLD